MCVVMQCGSLVVEGYMPAIFAATVQYSTDYYKFQLKGNHDVRDLQGMSVFLVRKKWELSTSRG